MRFKTLCAVVALAFAPFAQAAFVTLPETRMDAIFSQASFGNRTVDIRFGPVTTIVAPTLLEITSDAEISEIFGLHSGGDNVVNFYFVDTVDACSGFNTSIIGCGEFPGNDFVVESGAAAGTFGGELLAHELAHNLGLDHRNGAAFLMNPVLTGGDELSVAEVNAFLGDPNSPNPIVSPLIQFDALSGQRFIQINPVLIVERLQQVPEPSTLVLLAGGVFFAGLRSRRRPAFA